MLLYPARKRCRCCGRYFGFLVVDRLFCSYECAGVPAPSEDPADWPRYHRRRWIGSATREKVRIDWPGELPDGAGVHPLARQAQQESNASIYFCEYCRGYHLGHKSV